MSEEWLDIQSFISDQKVLQAINDLSIAVKLGLAGVQDSDREQRTADARTYLKQFLAQLDRVLAARETDEVVVGVDPRLRSLADSFAAARRNSARFHSALLRLGPEEGVRLLDAPDPPAKRELLEALNELRDLVAKHQQTDSAAIFEDF